MSRTYRLDPSARLYTAAHASCDSPRRATIPTYYGSERAPRYEDRHAGKFPAPIRLLLHPVTNAELDALLDSLDLL